MREDIRARSTYIVRAALVALVLFFLWVTHENTRWSGAVGLRFLETVVWIDLFVLSVVGLSYFASAITEEKEGETLGLLRMTNLNALSILLGKSTARLIGALCIIGAQLPFMLVAVTMGGVAVRQVYAAFSSLLGYAFLLANLGTLWSVVNRKTATATMATAFSIAGLLLLPWLLYDGHGLPSDDPVERFLNHWCASTPFHRVGDILRTNFDGAVFGWQFVVSIVGGLLFFFIAWRLFERHADPENVGTTISESSPATQPRPIRRAFIQRATIPALRWKDYRYIAGGSDAVSIKSVIMFFIALGCTFALGWGGSGIQRLIPFGAMLSFWSAVLLGVCLAIDASRIFKREREERTLSSLMTLPISAKTLAWQKMLGCLKTSIPPAVGLAAGLILFGIGISHEFFKPYARSKDFLYASAAFTHATLSGLFLPVLIAWLSLRMRWGALPIGGAIWFFGNWILGFLMSLTLEEGAFVALPVVSFVLLVMTWHAIPKRLEKLAAEE